MKRFKVIERGNFARSRDITLSLSQALSNEREKEQKLSLFQWGVIVNENSHAALATLSSVGQGVSPSSDKRREKTA